MQSVPIATARVPMVPNARRNAPRATARAPWHRVLATVVYMAMAAVCAKEWVGTKELATIVYRGILVANVKNATATVAAPPTTNNAAMATMVRAVATAGKDGRGPIANRAPTTTVGVKYPFGWCLLWRWRW